MYVDFDRVIEEVGRAVDGLGVAVTVVGVILAAIGAIRSFLSFTLEMEISGRWPWQQRPAGADERPR